MCAHLFIFHFILRLTNLHILLSFGKYFSNFLGTFSIYIHLLYIPFGRIECWTEIIYYDSIRGFFFMIFITTIWIQKNVSLFLLLFYYYFSCKKNKFPFDGNRRFSLWQPEENKNQIGKKEIFEIALYLWLRRIEKYFVRQNNKRMKKMQKAAQKIFFSHFCLSAHRNLGWEKSIGLPQEKMQFFFRLVFFSVFLVRNTRKTGF